MNTCTPFTTPRHQIILIYCFIYVEAFLNIKQLNQAKEYSFWKLWSHIFSRLWEICSCPRHLELLRLQASKWYKWSKARCSKCTTQCGFFPSVVEPSTLIWLVSTHLERTVCTPFQNKSTWHCNSNIINSQCKILMNSQCEITFVSALFEHNVRTQKPSLSVRD